MPGEVIEKEFPLGHAPKVGLFVVIETDHEGRDEIELCPEVGEWLKSTDSLDYTTNAEEASDVCKHGHVVHIESEPRMPEQLGDVEKISRAAAKVENALSARQIELDLTNPANVHIDPAVKIEILRPMLAGIFDGIPLPDLLEAYWVDCLNNAFCLQRKSVHPEKPKRVLSRAG